MFAYLHAYHPDAYFILATRDVDAWVLSRLAHGEGSLTARAASALGGMPAEQVAAVWREQFVSHEAEVERFFAARPDARYLRFDLARDEPTRVAEFLAADFAIDPASWLQANATSGQRKARALARLTASDAAA